MNFLFVNHHANAPAYGNPYRTFFMARHLVRMGHKVTIVAAGFSHIRQSQPNVGAEWLHETHEGVSYIFLPTPPNTTGGLSRVGNLLGFVKSYFKYRKQIKEFAKPDVVIEGTTHILPVFVSKMIAKAANAPLIYEARDLWPASPIEISGKSKYHPYFILIGMAQRYALSSADCVISTLKYADKYFSEHIKKPKKFAHIQNGIDKELFEATATVEGETLRAIREIKSNSDGVIGYTGSIGLANGLDSLAEAARQLKAQNISVVLVGQGARKDEFRQYAQSENLTNLHIFDSVSKAEVIPITQEFDLGFVGGVFRSYHKYGSSPNKVFDYMMCGVPVLYCICTDDDFVKQAGCGFVIPRPTGTLVAQTASEFFNLPEDEQKQLSANGRKAALEKYDYATLTNEFLAVVEGLKKP